MSGEVAAIGDAATGVALAHAVDPPIAGATPHGDGGLCLNCGMRLIGAHCHACGQAGHVHRTVGAIGHELAHGVFHFEGRIWRTLPMLALSPGALTRRYVAGERVRFVSPLALFLFSVFLMFAAISAFGPTEFGTGFNTKLDGAEQTRIHVNATGDTITIGDRRNWLTGLIGKVRSNPGLFAYKLQSSAYKYSWLLIPISTPFVALLFLWRRRFGLYDHAVFVTYSLAFMTLLVVALTLLGVAGVPGGAIAVAAIVLPPLHMYGQLRGTYSLRPFSAIWRTAALLVFTACALSAFAAILLFHELAA